MAGHDDFPMAVVVVNYASAELIAANFGAHPVIDPAVTVVLVDNFSTTGQRRAARELAQRLTWHFVAVDGNPGFGTACNRGAEFARQLGCTSLLFLNPDADVQSEVVTALRAHIAAEPSSLVSPRIESSSGRLVFRECDVDLRTGHMYPVRRREDGLVLAAGRRRWLSAACLAMSVEMFERVGGFDESFFLYWEDVDLSLRCFDAGATLIVRDDLVATHDEGGTQGTRRGGPKSALYYRYNCRNRLVFGARHLSRRGLSHWMLTTPVASWRILLRGGRRQILHPLRPLGATVAGSLAGLAIAARVLLRGSPRRSPDDGKRTRSVLVAHPGAELYGSDRVMLETVAALRGRGWQVTVTVPQDGPLIAEARALGASVCFVPSAIIRKSALRPAGFIRLAGDAVRGLIPSARLIRRAGLDGVYVSTMTIPMWPLLGRLLGRRVVLHVHEAENATPAFLRAAMALPVRFAHRVVVNSDFSLDTLLASAPSVATRSAVVLNAVPGPGQIVPPRRELDGPINLLFVGRLSPRKGPQVALQVLAELTSRKVEARLQLLGSVFSGYEWFEEQLIESVQRAGLAARVEFLGFEADIWDRVAAADVVLVPSTVDEPFGNTAVEAVLAARPVIVSSAGGLPEAVAGYGSAQIVDPTKPAAWADAVEKIRANWSDVREQAMDDAADAATRHASNQYRSALLGVIESMTSDRQRREGPRKGVRTDSEQQPAPKVLIAWAESHSTNLGVQALGRGTAALVTQTWPDADISFQGYGPGDAPVRIASPKRLLKQRFARHSALRDWMRQFDLVVDTRAGDSFADIYGLERLVAMSSFAEFARQCKVPAVLGPQTIGPFETRRGRLIAKWTLRTSSVVMARDSISAEYSAGLGRPVDVVTTDVVFALPVPARARSRDVIFNVSGLLWQPNPHVDHVSYRRTVQQVIERLQSAGREVVLLAHVLASDLADNDVPALEEISATSSTHIEVLVPESLEDVRDIIASGRLLIGSRMHACLNALSVGTPAIALAYSRKFEPLLQGLQWPYTIDLRRTADPVDQVMEWVAVDLDAEVEMVRVRAEVSLALAKEALAAHAGLARTGR